MIRELFRSKYLRIIEKEVEWKDKKVTFEIAERAPGVRVLLINGDNRILLSKERRQENACYDYRLPGGKIFDNVSDYISFYEGGGDIIQYAYDVAKKETKEEAGLLIHSLELQKTDYIGSTIHWDLYYFLSKNFTQGDQNLHGLEDISIAWYSFSEVLEFLRSDSIKESRTKAFLYDYILNNYDLSNK